MADRLARNKKPCIRPPAPHHILDRRVCDEVLHVRFPSHSYIIVLSSNICDPKSLSNLFNTLPRESALRPSVYKALFELASSNDELHVLQVSRAEVEKWLKEWDVTPAEKCAFLKTLVDGFSKAGQLYVTLLYRPPLDSLISNPPPPASL